jgi:ketosteroid isomerase-like protein
MTRSMVGFFAVVVMCSLGFEGRADAATQSDGSADIVATDIVATLQAYEAAWGRQDGSAVASFYYEPAMRVGQAGPVVRQTRKDQEAFFNGFLTGLVARGFERSEWAELDVRLLDAQTAIASGVAVRYKSDGEVLERVAVTYGLRKTEAGWKIFLSAAHAGDTPLRFR